MDNISIGKIVNDAVYRYDQNRNGVIDLDSNQFNDESSYDESRIERQGNTTYRIVDRFSNQDLFVKADVDGDKKVTKEELTNFVSKYDKDNDGKLSARSFWDWVSGKPKGELDVFNQEVPERRREIFRQVIAVDPPMPPIPNPPMPHM
ncbi:MAG: hypothetical protein U0457_07695 [Candidatus Sericytochromatia bacterium]